VGFTGTCGLEFGHSKDKLAASSLFQENLAVGTSSLLSVLTMQGERLPIGSTIGRSVRTANFRQGSVLPANYSDRLILPRIDSDADGYSALRAVIGSMRELRQAGIRAAIVVTTPRIEIVSRSVSTSSA
jgi:hypothetical protein